MVGKTGKLLFIKLQSKMVWRSSTEIANFEALISPNRHRATLPDFANALAIASVTVYQSQYNYMHLIFLGEGFVYIEYDSAIEKLCLQQSH